MGLIQDQVVNLDYQRFQGCRGIGQNPLQDRGRHRKLIRSARREFEDDHEVGGDWNKELND